LTINKDTIILGIESSCDETSAAVLKNGELLSNYTAGQQVHERYGGVVPELASRAHQQNIIPVVDAAIREAGLTKNNISAVAFTRGPGLLGSLLVGTSFAKSFAMARGIPLVDVNHMKAHILAHFIQKPGKVADVPSFPFLCLTVSGGHTQLVIVRSHFDFEIIGETLDDAAGEAFDKTAKILGLPYPGGPLIDRHAGKGDPKKFKFPEPKIEGLNFSFSGLKTSVLYFTRDEVRKNPGFIAENMNDICASVQHTIVQFLLHRIIQACEKYQISEVAIAGGVSANSGLRKGLVSEGEIRGWKVFIPPFEYCTDNAAMIAMAGYFQFQRGDFARQDISPLARLPF
jgi:N6-L-threonylcarbamoyladenine synthase